MQTPTAFSDKGDLIALVRHRADDYDLVHEVGQKRHLVANLDAGHAGADRLKQAADALRCIGLHVPQVRLYHVEGRLSGVTSAPWLFRVKRGQVYAQAAPRPP